MRTIVLDSGTFFALERRDRKLATFLEAARLENATILIPASVIAEVWRDPPRHQSAGLLRAAQSVVELTERGARAVGALLGYSRKTQIVDAHVTTIAVASQPSLIVTSDPDDIATLLTCSGASNSASPGRRVDVVIYRI